MDNDTLLISSTSTPAYKGKLVDFLWAFSILTIPMLVCIAVVGICLYLCLVRPGSKPLA